MAITKSTAASDAKVSTTRSSRQSSLIPESTTASTNRKSTIPPPSASKPKPSWSSYKLSNNNNTSNNNNNMSTPAKTQLNKKTTSSFKPPLVTQSLLRSAGIGSTTTESKSRSASGSSDKSNREEFKPIPENDKQKVEGYNPSREPIQAYLRIRPDPTSAPNKTNYIQVSNDTEVLMIPPTDHRLNPSTSSSIFGGPLLRSAATMNLDLNASVSFGTLYKFTRVFSPSNNPAPLISDPNSQANFFKQTTLPLIQDLFNGQNCLLFAYGPTGSGKTWTVQGDGEDPGLLPRAMDVIWNSVKGKESKSMLRPTRLAGVEMIPPTQRTTFSSNSTPLKKAGLHTDLLKKSVPSNDDEIVEVSEEYEYSIWVSYAEIYNEKIYDLLESPLPTPIPSNSSTSTSHSLTGVLNAGLGFLNATKAIGLKGLQSVKRNALSLKSDSKAGNKYVHGMKEVRVHSAEEARALLDRGQVNRRVFSTLANRVSSRSHSVFTIKVIRILKGATNREDSNAATSSRFSIVDLAGSERVANTQTSGDRLKEAGNINKSLMVLGQCMEVLRKNQELESGRKPAIVPFRHSKLTELFQSFFVGDGKAVMIVNVNPFETGFDENSHVMKFSAVAKEIMTVKNTTPALPVASVPLPAKLPRVVRLSMIDGGEEQDIIYEEHDAEEDDDEEDEFVNALLDELTHLRSALFEADMRTIMAESQAKAQTVREYEAKLLDMERFYQDRLDKEAEEAESKLNAKLDILLRLQARTAATSRSTESVIEVDEEEERSYEESDEATEEAEEIEKMLLEGSEAEDQTEEILLIEASPSLGRSHHARSGSGATLSPSRHGHVDVLDDEVEDDGDVGPDESSEQDVALEEDDDDDQDEEEEEGADEIYQEEEFDISITGSDDASFEQSFEQSEESEEEYIPTPKKSRPSLLSIKNTAPTNIKKSSAMKNKKAAAVVDLDDEEAEVVLERKVRGVSVESVNSRDGEDEAKENDRGRQDSVAIEDDNEDGLIMTKSAKKAAGKMKKKRKLGGSGSRIIDAEDIDAIAESFDPISMQMQNSYSSRSLSKASSVRSLKR